MEGREMKLKVFAEKETDVVEYQLREEDGYMVLEDVTNGLTLVGIRETSAGRLEVFAFYDVGDPYNTDDYGLVQVGPE
jgi:hypothetical protein